MARGNCKLTAEQRREIYNDHRAESTIAAAYGISPLTVFAIKEGRYSLAEPVKPAYSRTDHYRSRHYVANWDAPT